MCPTVEPLEDLDALSADSAVAVGSELVTGRSSSRAVTNELLDVLRSGRWRPRAWVRFVARAAQRSVQQAVLHPRALAEVTALHAAFALARPRSRWVVVSWALAASHLGMLEDQRSLGWANTITLFRANLPAVTDRRSTALLALGTDLADGRLARALGTTSPFGAAADSLADAAFWTWYAHRHEPVPAVRAVALIAWVAPVAAVTAVSVGKGAMVDPPRPAAVRPAAALQVALALRALVRTVRYRRSARGRE
ncbi:MAG: CDP-alcohol phosphatidyltransferase family protein [Catenulispora sp.]|nr:CDP-alcohol phosphatidyltransferase family protein [Catenulispora sp.]